MGTATLRKIEYRHGLTLIEILLAVGLMAIVISIAFASFAVALNAWRSGTRLADRLTHADHVIEHLVMGLRSAYYADTGKVESRYGFVHSRDSFGALPRDRISWVKLGGALIGDAEVMAGTPHRVEVAVDPVSDHPDERGIAVRAWRIDAQADEFEPDSIKWMFLTPHVVGFQCRVNDPDLEPDDIQWLDEWPEEHTNRLPRVVELTLFISPAREGGEPFPVRRIVEIPLSDLAWNPRQRAVPGGTRPTRRPTTRPGTARPRPGAPQ